MRFHSSSACYGLADRYRRRTDSHAAYGLHGGHEGVRDQDGHVEDPQAAWRIGFGRDEVVDVRVVAAHGRHHRAAARACGHNRAAHCCPRRP